MKPEKNHFPLQQTISTVSSEDGVRRQQQFTKTQCMGMEFLDMHFHLCSNNANFFWYTCSS